MFEQINYEGQNISCYIDGIIAIIKLKQNVFAKSVSDEKFIHILSNINNSCEIKALLIINEPGSLGGVEYEKIIINNIADKKNGDYEFAIKKDIIKKERSRRINLLRNFILKFVDFNKIIIFCLTGEVVTPFFGLSLAANFRFATRDMSYILTHKKFGLHPSGALPFFLKRYVNWPKQNEILYCRDVIRASEARELGIIDKVFPKEKFEENCILELNKIINKNNDSINKTRLLMRYPISELIDYFEHESLFI